MRYVLPWQAILGTSHDQLTVRWLACPRGWAHLEPIDDELKHALKQVAVVEGEMTQAGAVLTFPHFTIIRDPLY